MIDSRRLRFLLEVERTGSLGAAADALGYTPSAVSQQMRALEREAGAALIDRRGRGIVLTEAGRAMARHARRVVDALSAAETEVQAIAGLRAGVLRFGWFSTAGATLAPRAIALFRSLHPVIELVLEEADPDDCVRRLRDGGLDLALVYEFPGDEPLSADLRLEPLLEDRLRIALPPGHRLAGRRRIALAELAGDSWIQGVRHGSTVDVLPAACQAAGFTPRIALQTDDPTAWQGLVAAGVGISVIPELALPTAREDIVVRRLDAPALVRKVSVARPPGEHTSPAADAMGAALRKVAEELHPLA
jgi:DNA-binding transcriptional LysR family regulator